MESRAHLLSMILTRSAVLGSAMNASSLGSSASRCTDDLPLTLSAVLLQVKTPNGTQ